ncbi:Papain family cysteine protease [uncultured archaeon]|nr:Papain family cysteine protease [uncultured archaeon]
MLRRALLLLVVIFIISSISSGATDLRSAQELKSIQTMISVNGHSWTADHTSVSDLPLAEKQHRLGLIWQPPTDFRLPVVDMTATVASAWDWRNTKGNTKGTNWVTPIKDQGGCGSCVGFATVAMIESAVEISRGNPKPIPDLSEADLFFGGGASCNGWQFERALSRALSAGIADEACWPYDGDGPCRDRASRVTKITSWKTITNPKDWIATNGPIMTGMEVNSDFFCYTDGVYTYDYGDFVGNHAICVIGYDDTQNCWICKNSWGTGWGEDGFFKIAYGECGMGTEFPFYAVQMSSNPPTPPAPTGYGVIVLKKAGPVNLKVQTLKNAHIRELDITNPATRQITKVTSSVAGRNFNLGTFKAGDSLVFKIITDSGTFSSARSSNAGNVNHMYLLPLGANKWQMRWAVSGSQFLDMVCTVTSG